MTRTAFLSASSESGQNEWTGMHGRLGAASRSLGTWAIGVLTCATVGCPPPSPVPVTPPFGPAPVATVTSELVPPPDSAGSEAASQPVTRRWVTARCRVHVLCAPGAFPASMIPTSGSWEVQVDVSGPRDQMFRVAANLSSPNPRLEITAQPFAFVRIPDRGAGDEASLRLPIEVHGLPEGFVVFPTEFGVKAKW